MSTRVHALKDAFYENRLMRDLVEACAFMRLSGF